MIKVLAGLTVTAVAAGAFFMAGCESAGKKYSSTEYEMGDTTNQSYQDFSDVADGLSDVGGDMVNGVFEQSGMILGLSSSPMSKDRSPFGGRFASVQTDSFTAYYNDDTHYWHAYWSYTDSEKGVTAVVQDSIQFREGMNAVQWPDTLAITEILCGQAVSFDFSGESGSFTITASAEWTIAGAAGAIPSGGEITVNGNVSHNVETNGLSSGCNTELAMTAVYHNIESTMPELQASESCPESGSIHLHGTASSTCESDSASVSIDGTWDWQASYDEGQVSIIVNNGHFEWTYTGPCGSEPTQNGKRFLAAAAQ